MPSSFSRHSPFCSSKQSRPHGSPSTRCRPIFGRFRVKFLLPSNPTPRNDGSRRTGPVPIACRKSCRLARCSHRESRKSPPAESSRPFLRGRHGAVCVFRRGSFSPLIKSSHRLLKGGDKVGRRTDQVDRYSENTGTRTACARRHNIVEFRTIYRKLSDKHHESAATRYHDQHRDDRL